MLRYLPVNIRPTTSITLLISPTEEDEEFTDGHMRYADQMEGKLPKEVIDSEYIKALTAKQKLWLDLVCTNIY